MSSIHALVVVAASLVMVVAPACRPELSAADGAGGGGGSGGGGGIFVSLEPAGAADAAPLAVRIRVHGPALDAARVRFVDGEVGPGHLRQLAKGTPSAALSRRFLAATVWRDGADLVVAPHARLVPGAVHAVAVPDHEVALEVVAGDVDHGEPLVRVWPPLDATAAVPRVVLCAAVELPPLEREVELAPAGTVATIVRGASSTGAGRRCLRIVAAAPVASGTPLLPPPHLAVDGVDLAIDPAPLVVGDEAAPPVAPLACEADELPFGPGCARVEDDRATVRTPAAPVLWVVAGEGLDQVVITAPSEPFVVRPLTPASAAALHVSWTDTAGREEVVDVVAVTGAPRPHVVLNEVLADSVGPDATGEWIELLNDGAVPAQLGDLHIRDVGGEIELPRVELPPGAFALVVDDGWTPDPALDTPPPPGSLILRVPQLGRSGLANGGELLRLVDVGGVVVSAVPAIPSADPGVTTARREPWLADTPSSFIAGAPTPGAPNAPRCADAPPAR